jgi:hypothetical protein
MSMKTFVVQCRDCNEDVVFGQLIVSTGIECGPLWPVQLRCRNCFTTHVYAPTEFVPCEIDPS